MSTTIDNKVVEMSFDNRKFESGVKTSISTLDKLKEALNFDKHTESFKGLQSAANGIDVSGATNSFSNLAGKILALTPAIKIVQDLTGAAEKLVKSVASNTIGKIINGGYKRSSNLQDARFMLEGLDVEWENILKDIEYGVNDTAYGLDAAAKAASSLVASGVEIGTDMRQSLRGISGVAAMTNSSYEEISSIFTTVAGQGKLMTMQLRQLESRGMNAAATLANRLGTSEAAVREMVSKGEIDFATFSKAMDNAFGEHAKDSNKTLQGVLSNIGSALSRVGQRFIEPIIANEGPLVNMLNAVRLGINEINAGLQPISDTVVPWLTNEKMTGVLDKITIKIRSLTSGWNQLTQVFGNVGITTSELTSRLSVLYEGTEKGTKFESAIKNTDAFKEKIKELGVSADNYTGTSLVKFIEGTDALKQAISKVGVSSGDLNKILEATSEGLRDQVAAGAENADSLEKQAKKIDELVTNINEGRVSLDDIVKVLDEKSPLQIAMSGVSNIFNVITKILGTMSSAFKKVFGNRSIKSAKEFALSFESITKAIDDLFTPDVLTKLTNSFSGLFSIIDLLCEVILQSLKLAFTVINSIFGITAGSLLDVSSSAGNAVTQFHDLVMEGDYIGRAFESIGKWITFGVDCFKNLIKTIKELPIVQNIIDIFKDTTTSVMKKVTEVIKEVLHVLSDVNNFSFNKLKSSLDKLFGKDKSSDGISILSIFKNFSKDVDDASEESESSVSNFISKITEKLSSFKDKIKNAINVDFGDIFGVAAVLVIIYVLKNLQDYLMLFIDVIPDFNKHLSVLTESLTNFVKTLSDSVKDLAKAAKRSIQMKALASSFKTVAEGLIVLAGAIVILGKLDKSEAFQGAITLVISTGVLVLYIAALMEMAKKTELDAKGLLKIVGALGVLALIGTAITYVSTKIKDVDTKSFVAILGSIGIICLEMWATLKLIDKFLDPKTSQNSAITFIEASGAILIMAGVLGILSKITINKSIIGKLAALAAIAVAEFGIFKIMSYYLKGGTIDKTALASMLAVPLAMLEFALIVKAIGQMDFSDVKIGQLVAITVGLTVLVALLSKVAGGFKGIGLDLLALAVAVSILEVVIKSFKRINTWEKALGVIEGLFGVFVLLGSLVFFINKTVGKEISKTNRYLIEVAASIVLMVGSVWLFGKMDVDVLKKGITAVSLLMIAIGILTRISGSVEGANANLIKIGILIASLAAIVLVFKIVADGTNDVLKAAGALGILITTMSAFMYALSKLDSLSFKAILQAALCEVLLVGLAAIIGVYFAIGGKAEGAIKIATSISILLIAMTTAMFILSKTKPIATPAFGSLGIMIGIIAGIALVIGLLNRFGGNMDNVIKTAGSIAILLGTITICTAIMSLIGGAAASASAGMATMLLVIIGILGIATLFGSLNQISGSVIEGIDVMAYLGNAIVDLLCNTISKIANTFLDLLVNIGTSLSDFWNESKDFFDGISKLDESVLSGLGVLIGAMIELGATAFIQAIESFLGLEVDYGKLKSDLEGLATALNSFNTKLGDNFNADVVTKAAMAGQTLMNLINNLPSNNEIKKLQDWVTMNGDDPARLTSVLTGLGGSLSAFHTSLGEGFNADTALLAAQAGQALMSLATNLPKDKDLERLQNWFTEGTIDFENFGTQLSTFGGSLKTYSESISGMNSGAVDNSITCAKSLAGLAKKLPSYDDSVKSWFGGKKVNMATFGEDLVAFAGYLVDYSDALTGENGASNINTELIDNSVTVASALAGLANKLPKRDGKIQEWFGTKTSIDTFGESIENFAKKIVSYSTELKDMDKNVVSNTETIVSTLNTIIGLTSKKKDAKSLIDIGDSLNTFADDIKSFYKEIKNVKTDKINDLSASIVKLMTELKNASSTTVSSGADTMYKVGVNAAQGYINGIIFKLVAAGNAGARLGNATKESLKRALDIHSPSRVFEKLGNFTSEGFIKGLSGVVSKASAIFTNLRSVAETRFSGIIGDVKNAISSGISGQTLSITPVLDLSQIQNQAGDIGSILGNNFNLDGSFDLSSITASVMSGYNVNSGFDSLKETIKGISSGNITNEFNNTFDVSGYTGSTDELASKISELIQSQVERTGAIWA